MAARPRVAVDARTMQQAVLGGVGRGLANILPQLRDEVDLTLLVDRRRPRLDTDLPQVELEVPLTSRMAPWLQLAAPAWLRGFDGVFHCPFDGLPYWQPVPMVVTIHDISFETHPEWFDWLHRLAFRAQARHAARTARRILTVSEWERTQIADRYGVEPGLILVAPNGVDPCFRPSSPSERAALLGRLGLEDGGYIVALGGAARRGVDTALATLRILRASGFGGDLAVVGGGPLPGEGGLKSVPFLAAADLGLLFGGALAFLYATTYESYGLPGIEAMASGLPVVCARVGALPEVLGPAAEWAAAGTAEAFADALERLISDGSHAYEMRTRGLARAATAGWENAVAAHLAAYRAALDG